jgi:hypothetical protein
MKRKSNVPEGQRRNMAGWLRIAYCAKLANMHPDTLARWIKRHAIPVSMRKLGPRLVYVNAPQFYAWMGMPSLYTPEDLARANYDCARGWRREEVVDYVTGRPRTLDDIIVDGKPASYWINLARETSRA